MAHHMASIFEIFSDEFRDETIYIEEDEAMKRIKKVFW